MFNKLNQFDYQQLYSLCNFFHFHTPINIFKRAVCFIGILSFTLYSAIYYICFFQMQEVTQK